MSIWRDRFLAAVSISPTPMDRWRISVMGKPVLSLPINDPFRIPIKQAEGTHWTRVRERNRFLFWLGSSFFNTLQGQRCLESVWGCQDGSRYYQFTVYIPLFIYCLSMESFRSLRMNNRNIWAFLLLDLVIHLIRVSLNVMVYTLNLQEWTRWFSLMILEYLGLPSIGLGHPID